MSAPRQENIDNVLCGIIDDINRITDHLRSKGEHEAANRFSRDFTVVFQDLYGVVAPWDVEKCLMTAQAVADCLDPASQPALTSTPPTSWAAIAATVPLHEDNGLIKYRPSDSLQQSAEEKVKVDDTEDRRVIWIQPWDANRPLTEVSDSMHEIGAVYSMAYDPSESGVCVVFQSAVSASQFLSDCNDLLHRTGQTPFGPNTKVIPGMPFPADASIRRMDPPENARRRLTFARQALFSNEGSETQFRKHIETLVGPRNIELIWLFNTGNVTSATVIFAAVPLAKLVKDRFVKDSRRRGSLYEGVMVSYSHDPCERDLRLVSQIPGHANYIGANSNGNIHKFGYGSAPSTPYAASRPNRSSTFSSAGSMAGPFANSPNVDQGGIKRRDPLPRKITEEEGWQTVKKRK